MRNLFLIAAAIHAVLFALAWLAASIDIMILAGIGVVAALAVGLTALIRNGPIAPLWVGTAAGLTALIGWGSWLVLWALDPSRTNAALNILGVLLPPIAVLVYLVAALLPAARRA
ncbi:MAG: hypothetical protein Q4G50_08455 [Corynebacterium sp.]|uniref:hypothetical protein n=1 Tax=Corynebacterium sp. TaxID=1720 RepID=UPI0026DFB6EA|nr:hypothetical protein [Corynebacterium sp.]MDO5670019.1 hypothetical protein [Corynebacterium sp.]